MKKLLIRLLPNSEKIVWCLINDDKSLAQAPETQVLSEVTHLPPSDEVWLIIPGYDVVIAPLVIPKGLRRQQFTQSVPYALEEKVSEEIELLHFALTDKPRSGVWPVAIVKKELVEKWLAFFQPLNIKLTAIAPDYLLVPYSKDQWNVLCDENFAVVRTNEYMGFCVETASLAQLIEAQFAETAVEKPQIINFINSSPQLALDENLLQLHHVTVNYPTTECSSFDVVLQQATAKKEVVINLLQGPYGVKRQHPKNKLYAIAVGAVVGLSLVIYMTSTFINYHVYQKQLKQLNDELQQAYQEIYPHVSNITDQQQEMEKELTALRELQRENQFLPLLLVAGEYLQQRENVIVDSVEYHNRELFLNLELPSFDKLDLFSKRLRDLGLNLKREYARTENNLVKARLSISRGSS